MKPLFTDNEWSFDSIEKAWVAIDKIGKEYLGLDYYDSSIEIITSEQMLDAYSSVGMPIMYNHWSFGKSFIQNEKDYKAGRSGLAYEMIINTDPSIAYLMEDNTMTMQALVMAHAVCGHGSFFKNNYLFQDWTDAEGILDYLKFAKSYIEQCEYKYGRDKVGRILDAAHALKYHGIDKYKRKQRLRKDDIKKREKEWEEHTDASFDDLWRTVPGYSREQEVKRVDEIMKNLSNDRRTYPEENILYFVEKYSPVLTTWEKEIVRIVRKIAQYFYPQMQTQLMNEGWASFVHYHIMTKLQSTNQITEGSYLEFLESHSGVCCQRDYNAQGFGGINVYALGFAMMMDIKRMCQEPTEEDRKWCPDICDTPWKETLKNIVANYRDESFILQFLTPTVIKKFKLFAIKTDQKYQESIITGVHDDEDVFEIRRVLAQQYSLSYTLPEFTIDAVNWKRDRVMDLTYRSTHGRVLKVQDCKKTIAYLADVLWGFPCRMIYRDINGKQLDYI